jgi:glycosyltransferase involved in cell wall biosynthesis
MRGRRPLEAVGGEATVVGVNGRPAQTRERRDPDAPSGLRLAVYTDHLFWRDGDALYSDRVFPLFAARLATMVERFVFIARVDPAPGRSHYRMPDGIAVQPMPWVANLSRPLDVLSMTVRSLRRFWRVLDEVEVVWLVGSYPVSLVFAVLATLRGKRVALGVRQDLPSYARSRHPDRRWVHLVADAFDVMYRLLARAFPVIVVGPDLARSYGRASRLLQISVSMIDEADIVDPQDAGARSYEGELQILSVSRLDAEKNPLLLADVLARLRREDPRWKLVVCGDGPLEGPLADRLRELGVAEHAELRGYLTLEDGLLELYRESHAFLHVSWTEGLPQVLFEAFAAGLPIVGTAVGGVPDGLGDAGLLVPPGNAEAAAVALERIARDEALRERLIARGLDRARAHTTESECRRVVAFLAAGRSAPARTEPAAWRT